MYGRNVLTVPQNECIFILADELSDTRYTLSNKPNTYYNSLSVILPSHYSLYCPQNKSVSLLPPADWVSIPLTGVKYTDSNYAMLSDPTREVHFLTKDPQRVDRFLFEVKKRILIDQL